MCLPNGVSGRQALAGGGRQQGRCGQDDCENDCPHRRCLLLPGALHEAVPYAGISAMKRRPIRARSWSASAAVRTGRQSGCTSGNGDRKNDDGSNRGNGFELQGDLLLGFEFGRGGPEPASVWWPNETGSVSNNKCCRSGCCRIQCMSWCSGFRPALPGAG